MRISDWSSDVCSSYLAKDDGLQKVAELRSARVLWQQGKLDDALKLVDNNTGAFAPLFDELKGDIKLAKGDRDAARSAYQKAFEATPETEPSRNLLHTKLAVLNAAEQARGMPFRIMPQSQRGAEQ